jgi:hypothetical protein
VLRTMCDFLMRYLWSVWSLLTCCWNRRCWVSSTNKWERWWMRVNKSRKSFWKSMYFVFLSLNWKKFLFLSHSSKVFVVGENFFQTVEDKHLSREDIEIKWNFKLFEVFEREQIQILFLFFKVNNIFAIHLETQNNKLPHFCIVFRFQKKPFNIQAYSFLKQHLLNQITSLVSQGWYAFLFSSLLFSLISHLSSLISHLSSFSVSSLLFCNKLQKLCIFTNNEPSLFQSNKTIFYLSSNLFL